MATARILVLGDSISRGADDNPSGYRTYRGTLQNLLSAGGFDYNLVGPEYAPPASGGSDPDVAAWGGAGIDSTTSAGNNLTDRLPTLKTQFPAIELLIILIGWNDCYNAPTSIASRYATFLNTVQSGAWSGVKAIICTLHPQPGQTEAQTNSSVPAYQALNTQIRSMASTSRIVADLAARSSGDAAAWLEGMIFDAQNAPDFQTIAGGASIPAALGGHNVTSFKSMQDFNANWSANPPYAGNGPGGASLVGPQSQGPGNPRFINSVAAIVPWFWVWALAGDSASNTCIEARNGFAGAKRANGQWGFFFEGSRFGAGGSGYTQWWDRDGTRSPAAINGQRADGITSWYKPAWNTGMEIWPEDTVPSRGVQSFFGGFNRELMSNAVVYFAGCQVRKALINPSGANDIASARLGAAIGMDFYSNLGGYHYDWLGFPYNVQDGGHDRWKEITSTDWVWVTCISIGSGFGGHWMDPGMPPPLSNYGYAHPYNNIPTYSLSAATLRAGPPPLPQYVSGGGSGYLLTDYWLNTSTGQRDIHFQQSGADKVADTIASTIRASGVLDAYRPGTGGTSAATVPEIPGGHALNSASYHRLYGPGTKQAFTSLTSFAGVGNTQPGVSPPATAIETRMNFRVRVPAGINGTIKSIKYYSPGGANGTYALNNGGLMRIAIYGDDGTAQHLPNLGGTVFGRGDYTPAMTNGNYASSALQFPTILLNAITKTAITADQLLHFEFSDPNLSASNWSGVNVAVSTRSQGIGARWLSPIDEGVILRQGSPGFSGMGTVIETTITPYNTGLPDGGYFTRPIYEIEMDSGQKWGSSPMETASYGAHTGVPVAHWVRAAGQKIAERFTPAVTRTVGGLSIRTAASASGTLNVRVRLANGGTILFSGAIVLTSANFSTVYTFGGSSPSGFPADKLVWYDLDIGTLTLNAATAYDVELEPASGTWVFAARQNGSLYGFSYPAAFTESISYQWNGSAWVGAFNASESANTFANWDVVFHQPASSAPTGDVLPGIATAPNYINKLTSSLKTWGLKNWAAGAVPVWKTSSLKQARRGTAYSDTVSATESPTYTTAVALPGWLTLNSTTGGLSGTVPANAETFAITFIATNAYGSADITKIFEIADAVQITTLTLPNAIQNESYSQTISVLGIEPYVWSIDSGALPVGLTLNGGVISGLPAAASGTASFAVKVTDATGSTDTQALTITSGVASNKPEITTTSLPNGLVGSAYSQSLAATGAATITWLKVSGSIPPGITVNPTTGVISGTPTVSASFGFTVRATNSFGFGEQTFSILINATPVAGIASPWAKFTGSNQ